MKKLILGLLLAVSTITPATAQTSIDAIVNAARGNGTEVEVVNARVAICREIARDYRAPTVENAIL